MFGWTIQITLICILIVFLVHHIIHFLKETLTVPKIKDLVNVPHQRYKKMYETIHSQQQERNPSINQNDLINPNNPSNNPSKVKEDMKNELKQFMKMQVTSYK